MTNSKNILIDLLEKGFCVEIKDTDYYDDEEERQDMELFPIKNQLCFWLSGDDRGYDFDMDFLPSNFTITKIYRQPIKPFKVGDRVKISEEIKKCDDYKDYFIDTSMDFNNIYTIQYVDNELFGLNYRVKDKDLYSISHEFLIPVIDNRKQVGDEIETEIEGEVRTIKIIK